MSNPYVVEVTCMVLVHADDLDSATDSAIAELEEIAFDIDVLSTKPW